MKFIFFDLENGSLLSKDGGLRPFMVDVLEYCYESKIRVYLIGSKEEANRTLEALKYASKFVVGSFEKSGELPHFPDLVVGTVGDYLQKFPGLLIPPYSEQRTTKYGEISLAGRLLDAIKDRVVLNRYAPEKVTERKEVTEEDDKPKEDPTSWAFEL